MNYCGQGGLARFGPVHRLFAFQLVKVVLLSAIGGL
jgi:hypothetical protein